MHARDRHLGGADEIEIVSLQRGVGLLAAARELAIADEAELLRHRRNQQRREALAHHAIQRELHQRQLQQHGVALEDIAARARDLHARSRSSQSCPRISAT